MPVLCLSFAVVLLDQYTKHLAQTGLDRWHGIVLIPGYFDFRYVQNTGAAWGLMQGLNGWLVGLSILMLVLLLLYRRHYLTDCVLTRLAAGCVIGGIVGNLIDRLRFGYVVDFIHVHWHAREFPTFNIADAGICIGVGLFMIAQWRAERAKDAAGAGIATAAEPPAAGPTPP